MAKSNEELNQLKEEYDELNNKLKELNKDELKGVVGGELLADGGHFSWPGQNEKETVIGGADGPNAIFTPKEYDRYPIK